GGLESPPKVERPLPERARALVGADRKAPVASPLGPRAGPHQRMARRQLPDALEERLLSGHVASGEELRNRGHVERGTARHPREDRLDLGPEEELPVGHRVVEGLDAQPIPRQEEALAGLIPESEGEHALQTLDAPVALLLVEMEDRLRVAAGAVAVSGDDPPSLRGG